MKSGSLILLEHSGPVQGCSGIALPFTDWRFAIVKFKGKVFPVHAMKTERGEV